MNPLAAGFWGAFFGTAALMFGVSMRLPARAGAASPAGRACRRSSRRFRGRLPGLAALEGALEARVLAHVAILAASVLSPMMLSLLGCTREPAGPAVFATFGLLGRWWSPSAGCSSRRRP
jgi:hypothetical protein